MLVVVNIKSRLVGILNLPYKYKPYLDGVTVLVIHLYRLTVKVTGAERYLLPGIKRIGPPESVFLHSTPVGTKKYHHH